MATTTPTPDAFVGSYGPTWRHGVLAEHVDTFVAHGGRVRTTPSGRRQVAIVPTGAGYPVVCGDIIAVATEDGPISGRCGDDAVPGRHACAGHADERDQWMALSEIDRMAIERREDEEEVWAR